MKKIIKTSLIALSIFSLASCDSSSSITSSTSQTPIVSDEVIAKAISNLKDTSYTVTSSFEIFVKRKDEAVSTKRTDQRTLKYTFEEKAFATEASSTFSNYLPNKETGELEQTNDTRTSKIPYTAYFKDEETGNAYVEELTTQNTLDIKTSAIYDEDTASYDPIVFDNTFKNPFNYLKDSDFTKDSTGVYHLESKKALFLAECFQNTSLKHIEDVTVSLNNSNFSSFNFTFAIDDTDRYTLTNTYNVAISNIGNTIINHTKTYDNNNPELQALFDKMKQATSYTYTKSFIETDGNESAIIDDTTGFFTQKAVFFHHNIEKYPNSMYEDGQDYDYKLVKESDNIYYAYEWNKANDNVPFAWAQCYVSATTPLTYETFKDIGPTFYDLSPALFIKQSDGSYNIADEFAFTISSYFDNQFIGVHTDMFEGNTTSFNLKLTDEGFELTTSYVMENKPQNVSFSLKNINNTTLPSYLEI